MAEPHSDKAPYQVVARRFRPRTLGELVGQDAILQTLRSALQEGRVPHALLFSGSRGVGKTTLARILARCLNCERGPTPDPCGECDLCRSILEGSNTDVVEIDAASNNSVDDVRVLREGAGFASMRSRYKLYILDEAHMLSKSAFNALLKTIEEPPPHVVFVLATTELHKVPETIRSRCQVLLFRRVNDADIERRLRMIAQADGTAVPDEVLAEIAASSRGGMRDAETALERVLPLCREMGAAFDLPTYRGLVQRMGADRAAEVAARLLEGQAGPALRLGAELQQSGVDEREALGELVEVLRWCLLLKVDGPDSGLVPATGALREGLQAMAAATSEPALEAAIQAGILGRERMRRLEDRGAVLDLTMVRMASAGRLQPLAEVLADLRGGAGLAVPSAAPSVAPGAAPSPNVAPRTAAPLPRPGPRARPGAAAPSAPPPASAQPASPTFATDLRGLVLARLGSESRGLLRATLEQCQIEGPDPGGSITVRLATDRKMHADRLSAPGVQQEVRDLVAEVLGQPAPVEFVVSGTAAAAEPPAAADKKPGATARRVMERFGGRVVGRNPEDRITRPPAVPAADDAVAGDPASTDPEA